MTGRVALKAPSRENDYLILIIREPNIFVGRGRQVQAPTWDPSGDQTRCPTKKSEFCAQTFLVPLLFYNQCARGAVQLDVDIGI